MIGDDVNDTLMTPKGPERSRELFRYAVKLAKLAYSECVESGLDPNAEYSKAVDNAEQEG